MPIVFSLPLRDRFRGITHREGVLVEGTAGWGEFAPFLEYGDQEASHWWAAAHEAATLGWPDPVRTQVPVNCIVPAVTPERAAEIVRASGCRTAKVKVAERGQALADDLARVVDERWTPPVTASARLVSIIDDAAQHLGQAAYIRGLVR